MAARLEMALLGGVDIWRGDAPVTGFAYAKAPALLCYLAVTGRAHSREALAGLLWGGMPDERAKKALRDTLSDLKRLLEPHLVISRDTLAFNRDAPYHLDVEVFQAAARAARATDGPKDYPALREAVKLYRGDFLRGFAVRDAPDFEDWVREQEEHLRELAATLLRELARHAEERGEYAAAADFATRLIQLDPLAEEAYLQKVRLLHCFSTTGSATRRWRCTRGTHAR